MQTSFNNLLEILGYICCGGLIATPLIILNIRLAPKLGLIDWPKARGLAEDQIPIVGPSIVVLSIGVILILTKIYNLSPWLLTTSCVMAVMGYFDDRKPLSALDKIFFQSICAAAVVFLDPHVRVAIADHYGAWGNFLAFVCIIGLVNAINFIDGIDGLAGMVLFVGAFGFILYSHDSGVLYPYTFYAALFMGMIIPFLYFNVVKRRGFLGNVGSYFFSHLLVVMHLSIPMESHTAISRLSLVGLCFVIPIADAITVIVSRLASFRSPFHADKGHLHHRLVQSSLPLRYILMTLGFIEGAGLLMGYLLNRSEVVNTLLPAATGFSYVGMAATLILLVEKSSKKRIQNYFQRLDRGHSIYYFKYEVKNADGSALSSMALRRLEARISAEIRISDLCFAEKPNRLYVSLATLAEPLRGISARLENIFQAEKVQAALIIEQGEIVKVSSTAAAAAKPTVKRLRKRA